jgi:hypothetical protein
MAESAKEAVRRGELNIIPEHHKKIWFHWMDNIRWVAETVINVNRTVTWEKGVIVSFSTDLCKLWSLHASNAENKFCAI